MRGNWKLLLLCTGVFLLSVTALAQVGENPQIAEAAALIESGSYQDAEVILLEVLESAETVNRADANYLLGEARLMRGEINNDPPTIQEAFTNYDRAVVLYREAEETIGEADALYGVGKTYDVRTNYDEAGVFYRAALDVARRANYRPRIAEIEETYGDLEWAQGNILAARDRYATANSVLFELLDSENRARVLTKLGEANFRVWDIPSAQQNYLDAVLLAAEIDNQALAVNAEFTLGLIEERQGNLRPALTHYERARDLYNTQNDERGRARSVARIGNIYRTFGYTDAASLLSEAQTVQQRIGDQEGIMYTYIFQAQLNYENQDYLGADQLLRRSLEIANLSGDETAQAEAYLHLGRVSIARNDVACSTAFDQFGFATQRYRYNLKDPYSTRRVFLAEANARAACGEIPSAITLFQQAVQEARQVNDLRGEVESFVEMATLYERQLDTNTASLRYQDAIAAATAFGEPNLLGDVQLAYGNLLLLQAQYNAAFTQYSEAGSAYRQAANFLGEARALNKRAQILYANGENIAALRRFEEAQGLLAQVGTPRNETVFQQTEAEIFQNLGVLYLGAEQYDNAVAALNEALNIQTNLNDSATQANTNALLGDIAFAQGRYGEAQTTYLRARDQAEGSSNVRGTAAALLGLARLYALPTDQFGTGFDAQTAFEQAAGRYREANDPVGQRRVWTFYAAFEISQGDYVDGQRFLQEALETATNAGDDRGRGLALVELAEMEISRGQYNEARNQYERAITQFMDINDWRSQGRTEIALGQLELRLGNRNDALTDFENARVLFQERGDPIQQGIASGFTGEALLLLGNYGQAANAYETALTLLPDITQTNTSALANLPDAELININEVIVSRGNIFRSRASFYLAVGQFNLAADSIATAEALHRSIGADVELNRTLSVKGELNLLRQEYEPARQTFQSALSLAETNNDDIGRAAAEFGLARAISGSLATENPLGTFVEADQGFQRALDIYRTSVPNPQLEQRVALAMGDAYMLDGNYSRATDYYSTARLTAERIQDRTGQGNAFRKLGDLFAAQAEYNAAERDYNQAITQYGLAGDWRNEAEAIIELGNLYATQFQLTQAREAYERALISYQQNLDNAGVARAQSLIGSTYEQQSRFVLALERYSAAQDTITRAKATADDEPLTRVLLANTEGFVLRNLGSVELQLGQVGTARSALANSFNLYTEIGNDYEAAIARVGLGQIALVEGEYDTALTELQEAERIFARTNDRRRLGQVRLIIGHVYTERIPENRFQFTSLADQEYNNVTGIARDVGDPTLEVEGLYNRARVLTPISTRRNEAEELLVTALGTAQQTGNIPQQARILTQQGTLLELEREIEAAQAKYVAAVDLIEEQHTELRLQTGQINYIEQNILPYYRLVLNAVGPTPDEAFTFAERGRARTFLFQLGNEQLEYGQDNSAQLLADWNNARDAVNVLRDRRNELRVQLASPDTPASVRVNLQPDIDQLTIQINSAEENISSLEDRIRLENNTLTQVTSVDILTRAEVQAALDENTALVSYYLVPEDDLTSDEGNVGALRAFAFVLTATDYHIVDLTDQPGLATLDQDIAAYRANLLEERLYNIHSTLIAPLVDHPEGNLIEAENLIIVPHRTMNYLPFGALRADAESAYLMDEKVIQYTPSATVYAQRGGATTMADRADEAVLILGNPATGGTLPALPAAQQEASNVGLLLGEDPLLGPSATETSVWQRAASSDVIHIAAHGIFESANPLFSYLALTPDEANNGRLEVREIYTLPLRERNPLVILSACNTVVGNLSEGDDFTGLARAFLISGAEGVVASLWQVQDESTALLMQEFHTNRQKGMTDAQALTAAQRTLREQGFSSRQWAAFVLIS